MRFQTEITVKKEGAVGEVSPLIYGSFIEHTGRCVYDGVYAPGTPTADERGFNTALIQECKAMKLPLVRYPGGSFIATWNWEDAIGPKEKRKKVLNLPWKEMEPSEFGLAEAYEWSKEVGCELMICLNIATGTIQDALHLLEYCNFPGGTYYSDLRREHGYEEPFGIKYFSMGNEPDAWWQINLETAEEYARVSAECAKAMKMQDPNIEIICCSGLMGEDWTRTTLRHGYKYYDHISRHTYLANKQNNFPYYMAKSHDLEKKIRRLCTLSDEIGEELGIEKKLMISVDEWNVWYHSLEADKLIPAWEFAPHRLEDIYNMEDALVVGELLLTFLRCCDRVSMGCMAQLVNVIAPFMTDENGTILKQSIFYPYRDACVYGRGTAIVPEISVPNFSAKEGEDERKDIPLVDCMVVDNGTQISLFAINFSEQDETDCKVILSEESRMKLVHTAKLYHPEVKAENSFADPEKVSETELDASICGNCVNMVLKAHSWNVLILERA